LRLRIGTRGSSLARWQANWVGEQLQARGAEVELVPIATAGDVDEQGPIGAIGTSGVFTKEVQRALLDRRIDLAVHSLKDLPTEPVAGLVLAAVPERESTADVLISRERHRFAELPRASRIGTGSLRRQSQLLHTRPDLAMLGIRGNVETRLRKLHEGQYDALVLAEAGMKRLGLVDQISEVLPRSLILPAIGQGALGLETRMDDSNTVTAVGALDHRDTHAAVIAERSLLATLRGGCLAPVGAWGRVESAGRLHLSAAVLSREGARRVAAEAADEITAAEALGRRVADELLRHGAAELIASSRGE
jgi:hydroxymethylbilane synthase